MEDFCGTNRPAKSVQKFPKVRARGMRLRIGCSQSDPHISIQSQHKLLYYRLRQRKVYKRVHTPENLCSDNARLNLLIQGPCTLGRSSLAASSNRTSRIFSIGNDFCGNLKESNSGGLIEPKNSKSFNKSSFKFFPRKLFQSRRF
jgi:hypothetical protein